MKLIGELKKKVEKVETREEAKKIIEAAGMELTDKELDQASGGKKRTQTPPQISDAHIRPDAIGIRIVSISFLYRIFRPKPWGSCYSC